MNPPARPSDRASKAESTDPGIDSVFRFLTYSLSIPERALRGTAALFGGAVGQSARLLVPQAFQNSSTYRTFVSQMLEFVAHDIGGVAREQDQTKGENVGEQSGDPDVTQFVARKAVGSFVELAGLATIHLSPVAVLAIVSDVAYGSKAYLHEFADELRKHGIIDQHSTIHGAQELLGAIGKASGGTVQSLDLPPLTLAEIRKSLAQTIDSVNQIDVTKAIPQAEIDRLWADLKRVGGQQNVDLFSMGSALGMYALNQAQAIGQGTWTSLQVAGRMIDRNIFDHYRSGLREVSEQGYYRFLAISSRPYIDAVWRNFSTGRSTVTEEVVSGKWLGRAWSAVRRWWRGTPGVSADPPSESAAGPVAEPGPGRSESPVSSTSSWDVT